MPGAIVAAVVWVATSAAVQAVATAVVYGAVYGAVIGAATAVVAGGDIVEGALYGAAIGGLTAGVLEGASVFAGAPGAGAGGSVSGGGGTAGIDYAVDYSTAGGGSMAPPTTLANAPASTVGMGGAAVPPAPVEAVTPGISNQSAQIYAGLGTGLATAAGAVYAQKMEIDAEKDLLKEKAKLEEESRAKYGYKGGYTVRDVSYTKPQAQAAQPKAQPKWASASIGMPNWWARHINLSNRYAAKNTGLLAGGNTQWTT